MLGQPHLKLRRGDASTQVHACEGGARRQARVNPDYDLEEDEAGEEPAPEPLTFVFEEPELLDSDMLEMLAYSEAKARSRAPMDRVELG